MPAITFKTIPTHKIFLDADAELIYVRDDENPNGRREPHGREGRGYQRDPWTRIKWVNDRYEEIDEAKLRPIEVAKRSDGMYAAIDGGGRWLMAQMAGPRKPDVIASMKDLLASRKLSCFRSSIARRTSCGPSTPLSRSLPVVSRWRSLWQRRPSRIGSPFVVKAHSSALARSRICISLNRPVVLASP